MERISLDLLEKKSDQKKVKWAQKVFPSYERLFDRR